MNKALTITLIACILALLPLFVELEPHKHGHITLLTVTGPNNQGGTADLYLEIREGEGNVYIDTFPFTKLDTQVSTRFAKEIACKYADVDCSRYDFFYTIRSGSSIVGGPSAGAATAALTIATLQGKEVDQGVAMTGTINSGGIIGPVGGVDAKSLAAERAGMHTVIIPKWNSLFPEEMKQDNITTNYSIEDVIPSIGINPLSSYQTKKKTNTIRTVEAASITEAVAVISNEEYEVSNTEVQAPEQFTSLMKAVSELLCQRSKDIELTLEDINTSNINYNQSQNFLNKSEMALQEKKYYSSASYCFSANLRLRQLQLEEIPAERLAQLAQELNGTLQKRKVALKEEKLNTLTDIQTKAIVYERFLETEEYLGLNHSPRTVAYAMERYYSGVAWSNFFKLQDAKINLDQEHLEQACRTKISEGEERQGYLNLMLGDLFSVQEELNLANKLLDQEDYALCLFKASKAKAQLDTVLFSVSVAEEDMDDYNKEKQSIAAHTIALETKEGRFPFMGYSYYEYSALLAEDDPYLASLFSSYALELSDLSIYFPQEERIDIMEFFNPYVIGFLIGVASVLLLSQKKRARRKT